MTTAATVLFWVSAGVIVYTHLGYPLVLTALTRMRGERGRPLDRIATQKTTALPTVSLIVPAYDEEEVIAANVALLGDGWVYTLTLVAQLALLAAALLGRWLSATPFRVARYYVLTTASIAAGLWDRARHGATGRWEKAEGTR